MKTRLSDRLKSLPALVLQGFAAGAILFVGLDTLDRPDATPSPPASGSVLDRLEA